MGEPGTPNTMIRDPLAPLRLNPDQLAEVRDFLAERIRAGLEKDEQEIRALPAWLPQPRQAWRGRPWWWIRAAPTCGRPW